MREELLDLSTTERQLLYDIRSEIRRQNDLLSRLLEVLNPIAKGLEPSEVIKPKEGIKDESLLKSTRRSNSKPSGSSTKHPSKRKAVHDK